MHIGVRKSRGFKTKASGNERWQQQLRELLAAVHAKQQQFDQASTAYQALLKPWPKKSKESNCTVKKDAPDSSNNAADSQISPREEAELKVVNDLLKRAQKTRIKPASKKLKEHFWPNDDDDPSCSQIPKELWQNCDAEPQTVQDPAPEDAQPSKSKPVSVIKTRDSLQRNGGAALTERSIKNAGRKQQQQIQPSRENGNASSRSASRDASSRSISRHHMAGSITKPAPAVDQKRSKSFEGMQGARPSSRPTSSQQRNFRPAHATAPFKTDPTLHAPKRSAKQGTRPVKHQPSNRPQNYSGDRNYTNKVLPPIGSESEKDPSEASVSNVTECVLWDVCDAPLSVANEGLHPEVEREARASCEERLGGEVSGLTLESASAQAVSSESADVSVKVQQHPEAEASSSKPEGEPDIKLFSLLSDGSSVHIPPRVRRAFAKNQQLRKKVSPRLTERKAGSEGTDLGQRFADKLQQLFDPEEELVYRQQALECLHAHQQLLQLLTQLELDHLTEASSTKDVLRAKMLAEFVLSSFSAYSEEIGILSKVQFPDRPAVEQPIHKAVGHPYLWLPASLQGEKLCLADKLQYTSKTDLNQYIKVLLRLQTVQCEHHLMDILISDVLPWLQKQDCRHQDYVAVFRGLFALLTSNGSQLPVLICDSLQ
ncbi:hypothetical protein ACOMHN_005305 [Nucella lapillus]